VCPILVTKTSLPVRQQGVFFYWETCVEIFRHKDLLGIEQLSVEYIELIMDTAVSMKEICSRDIKKVPAMRGKSVVLLFQEPSTRTRMSFDIAARRLSADCISLTANTSSIVKGETLSDTAKNIEAMNPDMIILRHPCSGAPHLLANIVKAGVINAGDGIHEHPTQALLDLFTIREKKGRIEGLNVVIIGDIAHSRVARSNIIGLKKMGADVTVSGPPTLIPIDVQSLGVHVMCDPAQAVYDKDVIMVLRMQLERQSKKFFPSLREYATFFGLNGELLKKAKEDAIVMHPGPINRGVEVSSEVADGASAVILNQVANGVAVRMALLYLLMGGSKSDHVD